MNLIFLQNYSGTPKLRQVSQLGLNTNHIRKNSKKNKIYKNDVVNINKNVIEKIEKSDNEVYFDICESRFFKKESLLKGIWIYKSNIIPHRLCDIMKCNEKKDALIERLKMITMILTD